MAYFNLGVLLADKDRNDEAEQCYRKAIALDPAAVSAYLRLGILLANSDRLDEAEQCYRKVIALDHPVAGTLCGRCAWREGNVIGVELQIPASDLERVLRCICLIL